VSGKSVLLKHLNKLEKQALTAAKREMMYELVGRLVEREVRSVMRREGPAIRKRVQAQFLQAVEQEIPKLVKNAVAKLELYIKDY
jgi:hypothetical protein